MLMRNIQTLVVCGLSLLFVGCGGASYNDLCLTNCDSLKKCAYLTDGQYIDCKADCDSKRGASADEDAKLAMRCKNPTEVRQQQLNCYSSTACGSNLVSYGLQVGACIAPVEGRVCVK